MFLVPVCWYFFLQFFGNNQFSVEVVKTIPSDCGSFEEIAIVHRIDSLNPSKTNSLNRVTFRANRKKVLLVADTIDLFTCMQKQTDVMLVSAEGLWGSYELDREGVDRLLTELDILMIQKSYGKGSSR